MAASLWRRRHSSGKPYRVSKTFWGGRQLKPFNVLNRFRSGNIDTNLSSAQFGKVRNALDPRILQFALKYLF